MHLTAGMVLATGPVQVRAPAVVICMYELMYERHIYLVLRAHVVVAYDYLRSSRALSWCF